MAGEIGLAAIVLFGLYYTYFDYWDQGHPELWEGTLSVHNRRLRLVTERDAGTIVWHIVPGS